MTEKAKPEMLETALEMEEKGKAFYDKAVKSCKNEQCKAVFQRLAEDEVIHMERINKIYDALSSGKDFSDIWKEAGSPDMTLKQVFRDLAKKHGKNITADSGDVEALDVGIEFEDKSVKYYQERLDAAASDAEKEFFKKMIEEERDHHAALADAKFYLTEPELWFQEVEGAHFDGA